MPKDIIEEQSINERNIEILKQYFPNAIETDEDGKVTVNAQKLQMALDPSKVKVEEDGYELRWVGKKEAYHTAFTKNRKILKPLKDDSKEWDTTGNILIKGDNLDALRILKYSYFEQIKMIYIDPPYNTKSDEFVYNDDFTATQEETLEALGYSKESRDYVKNIYGAKTHSGWLSFMYPRLLLARDLLKEDGAIFISIDDNEVAQLKILCDEIFGEENFVAIFPWRKRTAKSDVPFGVSQDYEWTVCYAKEKFIAGISHERKYYHTDDFPNDGWRLSDLTKQTSAEERPNSAFNMIDPKTDKSYPFNSKRTWAVSKDTFQDYYDKGKIVFPDDYDFLNISIPAYRVFESEDKAKALKKYGSEEAIKAVSTDFPKNIGMSEDGNKEMIELFGAKIFSFPKPSTLIRYFMEVSTSKDDIILDFFAGSGTAAHAVMDLNATDGGKRKFICVQWAEATPAKSEARKAGYETIFDITRARIDKAGKKIVANENLISQNIDIGFRVFEVADDEKQAIYSKKLSEVTQSDLMELANTPKSEEPETILYNLLIADKLPLDTKIEELEKGVFYRAENVGIVLGAFDIGRLRAILKEHSEIEYISVYSPLIEDDNFNLMLHSLLEQDEYKKYKLRIRG